MVESNIEISQDRLHWGGRVEFLLAIIGYSVGIGNIWRFPYTCYESGGVLVNSFFFLQRAFLVAYLIMWTLCGVPLLYMELAIGQYTRLVPIGAIGKICPLLKGDLFPFLQIIINKLMNCAL
ncbi:hypothetical protein KUTeg_011883 [Tegillarca granosa]|uniref:Uncharacterized protein n=1 Tax=Tegillarca granosa TaxID=220873 RepID=A0ABQ9F375_TEGGR|nr:hypothetical protein KUTeg_011883 [Tegillarca granosa]